MHRKTFIQLDANGVCFHKLERHGTPSRRSRAVGLMDRDKV